ncbi:hypothetical protein [Natronococcus sp.]|uniref:hypothetical protein n=1 Tax=Natronococcus sp. TaxID=35747 RepID=UPI003A4E3AEB
MTSKRSIRRRVAKIEDGVGGGTVKSVDLTDEQKDAYRDLLRCRYALTDGLEATPDGSPGLSPSVAREVLGEIDDSRRRSILEGIHP